MEELFSNAQDCHQLAKILYNKLKNKIEFYGSTYQEVITGKYHCLPYSSYKNYSEYKKDELSFSYKFLENGFLNIGIGNCIDKASIGHKLAALSDLYEVLNELYGKPTLYYTIKDDDEYYINLQWSFINKEECIEEFKNGTPFDDGEIEELIIIDEPKTKSNIYQLSDITRQMISKQIGLPFELINLLDENIEDFVKYKKDINMNYPEGVKIDGYNIKTSQTKHDSKSKIRKK